MPQPVGLSSDNGVILTVGINVNGDRCELVFPVAYDAGGLNGNELCGDAVGAFNGTALTALVDCLSIDAYISFIQGVGMVDGKVPARIIFAPADHPGTAASGAMPSQVGALAVYYEDASDVITGERIRVAHNTIPGIAENEVDGDLITTGLFGHVNDFADMIVAGFTATTFQTWYRVLAAIRSPAGGLRRIGNSGARQYVGTQRRRLVPHF